MINTTIQTRPQVSLAVEGYGKHRIITQSVILVEVFHIHGSAIYQ